MMIIGEHSIRLHEDAKIITEIGLHGECEVHTLCQVVLINEKVGECATVNVKDGTECHDSRCGEISKAKGMFDKFGDKGVCLTVKNESSLVKSNDGHGTSHCFCYAGE